MSGAGRKSPYRKGATRYFENDEVELVIGDRIGKILQNRGGNIFDVQISTNSEENIMVKLPSKFHKVVWVKVRDYVIVEECSSKDEIPLIKYVLNRDHIKYLKKTNKWPEWLLEETEGEASNSSNNPSSKIVDMNNYMNDLLPAGVEEEQDEYGEDEEAYDPQL